MVTFACDDAAVETLIRELADRVVALGGQINADAEISCGNGNLSIRSQATGGGDEKLIFVPETALIIASQVSFGLLGNEIILRSVDGEMGQERRSLLDLMVEIYNLTGKIAEFRAASPFLAFAQNSRISTHLLAGRHVPFEAPEAGSPDFDDHVVKLFMKSRTLGYKFGGAREKTPVLMPVIDSLNHHPAGAQFQPVGNEGEKGLSVNVGHPLDGSTECFALYGLYDPLDTCLFYAYVEPNTPFVRSVPCVLEAEGLGRITVEARAGAKYRGPLAKEIRDLRLFMPLVTAEAPGHVRLSHLIIPGPTRKFALRRVLGEVIKLLDPTQTNSVLMRRIVKAERDLLETNIAYYRDLDRILDSSSESPALAELRRLAPIQRANMQAYIDAINHPKGR